MHKWALNFSLSRKFEKRKAFGFFFAFICFDFILRFAVAVYFAHLFILFEQ